MPAWVRQQLDDLVGLLTENPERTKAEFQRLGMRVTMMPTLSENGRSYYRADVVNSLPASQESRKCVSCPLLLWIARTRKRPTVERLNPSDFG
jgi:hypothetical protein